MHPCICYTISKNKRVGVLRSVMSYYDAVTSLRGNENTNVDSRIDLKSNSELYQIAEQTKNPYLLHHTLINQMHVHCYFREYTLVVGLAENYHTRTGVKRILDFFHTFYLGICKSFLINLPIAELIIHFSYVLS